MYPFTRNSLLLIGATYLSLASSDSSFTSGEIRYVSIQSKQLNWNYVGLRFE